MASRRKDRRDKNKRSSRSGRVRTGTRTGESFEGGQEEKNREMIIGERQPSATSKFLWSEEEQSVWLAAVELPQSQ